MSASSDDWGCGIFLIGGLIAAVWAFNNYTIVSRDHLAALTAPDEILNDVTAVDSSRPSGLIEIDTLPNGTVWRLDADTVIGPRSSRQFWLKEDHSKAKDVKARETQTLYRTNCDTTAFRTLKVVEYDAEGKPMNSWGPETFADKDDYPPPESRIGAAVRAACSTSYDSPQEESAIK